MPWVTARARGSPLPQDLFIPASGLKNIFQISPQNTIFTICTPVGFTRMQRLKNTGPRYIYINRYLNALKPVYEKLLSLVKGKDYFVLHNECGSLLSESRI